jgi:hypothetical protein
MRSPPKVVTLVARTHWLVGGVAAASIALLHFLTQGLPGIEFESRTYIITGSLAGLYLLAGTLVWFGVPPGQLLSRVCGLLYLPRPSFGFVLWDIMNSPEFRTHFARRKTANTPGS